MENTLVPCAILIQCDTSTSLQLHTRLDGNLGNKFMERCGPAIGITGGTEGRVQSREMVRVRILNTDEKIHIICSGILASNKPIA